ncbi:MAG: ArnT family glycosyltransferase [Pseudomonadota bacterium]|jgi:hypothetical protein
MSGSSKNLLKPLCASLVLVAALFCLGKGVLLLEHGSREYSYAYTLILASAAALALFPRSFSIASLAVYPGFVSLVFLGSSLALQVWIARRLWLWGSLWSRDLVPYWFLSMVLLIIGGFAFDRRRRDRTESRSFTKTDWLIALGLFIVSWFVRMLGHTSMAVDEGIHFDEMWGLVRNPSFSPWGVTTTGYPNALHRLVFILSSLFEPVIDRFAFIKLLVAGMGGLSVGVWFLVVRIFAPRGVALSAAVLLVFLGWHWLNSRFGYLYPYDLAFISIAVLAALISFERQSVGAAITAGVFMSFAFLIQKCGVFLLPLLGIIGLDYLLTTSRERRGKVFFIGCLICASAVACYLPFLIDNSGLLESPRFNTAKSTKDVLLAQFKMTKTQAFFEMWLDAIRQLQSANYDAPRHMFRTDKALLDPLFSALFSVGVFAAVVGCLKNRQCRFQLYGLVCFIAPMVVAFPLDSLDPHGLARRLLGVSFFAAWIAASGAVVIASRLVRPEYVAKVCVLLCAGSLLLNMYYLATVYNRLPSETWTFDYGGKRASLMSLARSLARDSHPVIVWDEPASSIKGLTSDLPNINLINNVDQVKELLQTHRRTWSVVVIPWSVLIAPSASVADQLVGIIPSSSWSHGPVNNEGIPTFGYAFVPPHG